MSDRDLPQARELAHLRQPKREQPAAHGDRHPAARLHDELQQHLGNRGLQALLRGERSDPTSAHLLELLERARAGWDVVDLLPWKGPMSWTRERCGLSSSDRVDPTRDEVLAEFSELLGVDLSNVDVRTTGAAIRALAPWPVATAPGTRPSSAAATSTARPSPTSWPTWPSGG